MGKRAAVTRQTKAADGSRLLVKSSEVLSVQQVNAAQSDTAKVVRKVVLGSLKPVRDVLAARHGCNARPEVNARGHQNRQVVTGCRQAQ